jgi:hypothetical protein
LPEEKEEFETAQKGIDYLIALDEMDNFLRGKLKYSVLTDEEIRIYEEIREKLRELRYNE